MSKIVSGKRRKFKVTPGKIVILVSSIMVLGVLMYFGFGFLNEYKAHAAQKKHEEEIYVSAVNLLNEAVEQINSGTATIDTMEKCLEAVKIDPTLPDCYTVINGVSKATVKKSDNSDFDYSKYLKVLDEMITLCQETDNTELKVELLNYAVPTFERSSFEVKDLMTYQNLINEVLSMGPCSEMESMHECIKSAMENLDYFEEAFDIFESGDFEPIMDFVHSDEYKSIRDTFLNGENTFWAGETYIPVSREKMFFMYDETKGYSYSFANFEENPQNCGVINIWAAIAEDSGIQRLALSYEPASQGEYYPHTEYDVTYMYGNVKIKNSYIPQMNFHLETKVRTEDGEHTTLIGDWGGASEWIEEYD